MVREERDNNTINLKYQLVNYYNNYYILLLSNIYVCYKLRFTLNSTSNFMLLYLSRIICALNLKQKPLLYYSYVHVCSFLYAFMFAKV